MTDKEKPEWDWPYFKMEEFYYPLFMDSSFIRALCLWRDFIQTPVIILQSNMPKEKELEKFGELQHSDLSLHYKHKAVDVFLPKTKMCLFDQFISATRFFTGVGVYPQWRHSNYPRKAGGLHLQWEEDEARISYWISGKDANGKKGMYGITKKNLKKFKII